MLVETNDTSGGQQSAESGSPIGQAQAKIAWIAANLKDGEHYAGLILGKDGEPDHHLILLPGDNEKKYTWDQAMKVAKQLGGDLPTRREQSLLYTNLKDQFQPTWYWSREQYATNPSLAWGQGFDYGFQYYYRESYEGRARAVRRLEI